MPDLAADKGLFWHGSILGGSLFAEGERDGKAPEAVQPPTNQCYPESDLFEPCRFFLEFGGLIWYNK